MHPFMRILWISVVGLWPGLQAAGSTATLPITQSATHLGAASCAGSHCHGAAQPSKGVNVSQNEYFVWKREDRHAQAYVDLDSPRGRNILANLGAPDNAEICLHCHADNVPEAQRGERFDLSDGVACETCHGGAEPWLGSHVSGATVRSNVAAGMYPVHEPEARGRLCLSCHRSTARNGFSHRILAAGHPPLDFELDTYTATQPAHYEFDADYRTRKPGVEGIRIWAVGQFLEAEAWISRLRDIRGGIQSQLFPELSLFTCAACHRPAVRGAKGSVAAGLRWSGTHLKLAGVVADLLGQGKPWRKQVQVLDTAAVHDETARESALKALARISASLRSRLNDQPFDVTMAWEFATRIVAELAQEGQGDFELAQQGIFGLGAMLSFISGATAAEDPRVEELAEPFQELQRTLAGREQFHAEAYAKALERLRKKLPQS